MKRTIALLLTVLMVLCCIPSTLMTAFAVDPSFTPNSVRNQTYDGAYNQYIPETVIVDGNFEDTAWAYEDWKNVSTITGSWNTDPISLPGESVNVDGEKVPLKASDYSYRFQLKTDYEYFYGAIELNYDWNGDIVIWLNDGRWENCTDRIVINPTILTNSEDKASVYNENALRIERAIHTVIDPVNKLNATTHTYDVVKYEKNAAGAFYPAMCYPSGKYVAGEANPTLTDWVDVTDELKAYQYASEETLYRCVKEDNKTRIEFRILNYAFECGKIEQDGEQQQEDYNPNYHYYVSVGFGYDNNGAVYNAAGYHPTTETATKTYFGDDKGGSYTEAADEIYKAANGKKLTKEEYYYNADKNAVCPALYYPRIEMKDGTNRAEAIPSMKNWPASTGLIPDILFANDTANNEEKMVVDGNFTEEIWSTLTDKHMGGSGATLDLSKVLYSDSCNIKTDGTGEGNAATDKNLPLLDDRYTATGKKTSFKMELRYDGTYIYGAAIAFVPDGGAIMPRLTLDFAELNDSARAKLIVNGGYTSFTDKNGVNYNTSRTDIFQCYRQKIDGLWNFEFKVKADLIAKDASNNVYFNAFLQTDAPYVYDNAYINGPEVEKLVKDNGATYNTSKTALENLKNPEFASGVKDTVAKAANLLKFYNSISFINSYIKGASLSLGTTVTSDKVIYDGKVDTYDWAALNAFDNVVSGQYQDDYVVNYFDDKNPLNVENIVTTTTQRDMASYYKLTSDGEYLYGGAIVQFGSGTNDYWHLASVPGDTISDAYNDTIAEWLRQYNYNQVLLGENTDKNGAYSEIDLFKIWLTNNPEHTNSLEREGATAVLNIAILKRNSSYEAYSFIETCTYRNDEDPGYNKEKVFNYDAFAKVVPIDYDGSGNLTAFSLEFRASLRDLELKETENRGFYGYDGQNNNGSYELVEWYDTAMGSKEWRYVDSTGRVYEGLYNAATDKRGNPAYINDRPIYSTDEHKTGEFEDAKYHKTIDGITILTSYEYEWFNGHEGNTDISKGLNGVTLTNYSKKDSYFIERGKYRHVAAKQGKIDHVDYTKNDQYFGYYVTIENAIDNQQWETLEKTGKTSINGPAADTNVKAEVKYGRLINKKSESPIAPDAWTGHVYAAILNGEAHWWRRNFFNVEATHKFGYSDMLDNMVVDGKLDEHLWHVKGEGAEATSAMSSVTPVTGVWKKNPTQNEVFSYTYRVWTDNNYVYGAAWLDKEIVKCGSQISADECTKLEIHFENAGKNYTFDMYFKDDSEVTGNYYIDGEATKPLGGLDSYFQKTITYANKECYFEFRIDLSLLGYTYTQTPKTATNFYERNVKGGYDSDYGNLVDTDGNSNIRYHLGISQPCSTGAAFEVLTLFADPHGALKAALAGKNCDPDYSYDVCVYPGLSRWNAADAMEVEQTEHFAGEKIRVDGTLNDTGWNEDRWIDVDRNVNASENKIYDDLQYINMKYMIRSDDEYYYIGALMDVTFNSSTRPAFTFWILNETEEDGKYDVDYIKLSYDDKQNSYPYSQSILPRWQTDKNGKEIAYTNSKLYECYDIEDLAGGKIVPTFYGEDIDVEAELAKLSILNGDYTYKYSNNGDKNVVKYDPNSKQITFNNISIQTSLHGKNGDTAGLYGESEVMQEMNEKFDIVNYGQIVGKQHAVIQSANGVMINDTPGKSTQTVVEFRVKKSSVDKDGDTRPGFKYAVQATATFNNQEYDLIYPYVDNKVGEERERDDYNYPAIGETTALETDAWVETAVDVNDDSHLRYLLRNNTNGVVTLGSKTASEGEGENAVYKMRFGALYTEDYIRNQKFAHTAIIDKDKKNDTWLSGESVGGVTADFGYDTTADGYHGGAEAEDGADTKYTYWDITKLGVVIYPTHMLYDTEAASKATSTTELNEIRRTQSVPLSYYAGRTVVFAQAHSIVTWHGNSNVQSNFADYESFQYYIALTGIKAQNYGMKYSFAAMNSFDYMDITSESEIGNGENMVETRTDEENGYLVKPVPQSSKYLDLSLEENKDIIYNGRGVDVNYYYGAVLERSPQMIRMVTNNGTIQDGDDSSNEESVLPDNENEGDYNGKKVAYIPLDNRPVNKERVEYLAQSAGFELLMPEEDFYRTATKGQKNNSNGKPYGNQAELLSWLYQIEQSEDVDYYIISLDQLFYGGLAESTSASRFAGMGGTTASIDSEEQKVIDYLIELAKEHYVYYFTSITPTVGLEEYVTTNADWTNDTFRNAISRFTEMFARPTVDFTNCTEIADFATAELLSSIRSKYFLKADNSSMYPDVGTGNEKQVDQLVTTRLHKLQLIQKLASAPYGYIDHLVVGVDDDRVQTTMDEVGNNIQTNEINYVKALFDIANKQTAIDPDGNEMEKGNDRYIIAEGIDQLGLGGISNLSADLYATQIEHFSKKNGNLKYDNNGVETDLTVVGNLGVDVKVEYIGTTSETTFYTKCTEVVDEVRYGSKTFDDLINEQIIAAGGRRIVEDKSKALGKGTLVLLVLLPGSENDVTTGQVYVNLATRALAHMQSFTPVAIVAFGHYGAMTQLINGSTKNAGGETINNPGRLLATYAYSRAEGHDFRNTPAQAVGVTISNAIARYSYLTGPRQTVEAHEGFYKYMGYSWINDLSYNSKGLIDLEMKDDISSGTTVAKSEANDYNSAFYKYKVTTFDSDKYFTRYQPQWIAEELNLSEITTRINVERDGAVSEFSNLADIMIGNGVNPLNRPHEFTFDVAVIENGGLNVARNKGKDGKYIVNRSEKYGTLYTNIESETAAAIRLDKVVTTTGVGNAIFVPLEYDSKTHRTASIPSDAKTYEDYLKAIQAERNYTISVTNDSYIDNEAESVTNYRFSYDAELTDGHIYKYLETVTHNDGTIPSNQIENGAIKTNSVYKGFSNNQWWCLEQNYNCHYAGNGVYFGYVVVDLQDNYDLGAVRIHLLNDVEAEVHEPGEIRFLYSTDGTHFTYLDSFDTNDSEDYGYWSMLDAQGVRARYVKIEITLGGQYAFMNEIEVYAQDTQTIRVGTYNIAHGKDAQNVVKALNGKGENDEASAAELNEAIKLLATDIEKADLDVVFLQEISINATNYTHKNGFGYGSALDMIGQIAAEAGFPYYAFIRAEHWNNEFCTCGEEYCKNGQTVYHKITGSVILSKFEIDRDASAPVTTRAGVGTGQNATFAILEEYKALNPANVKGNPNFNSDGMYSNYDYIYLKVPTGNKKFMNIPAFSAHCTPQTLKEKVLNFVCNNNQSFVEGSNVPFEPLKNLIVAGDFNNPTFKPLKEGFGDGMTLTVNDINKLVTNEQGKSMDNIVYDNSVYTLMDSGVIQSGNSDHYLVWAELQYTVDQ